MAHIREPFRKSACRATVRLLAPVLAVAALGILPAQPVMAHAHTRLFDRIDDIALPAPVGAHEPSLAQHDGALYLSWLEHDADRTRVMMARRAGPDWSAPRVVQEGSDLFVNWADFPAIAVLPEGTIAVHWLREIGPSRFDYRAEIALSADGGLSWSAPVVPHEDRSFAQHGFVSMLPGGPQGLTVVWLDGRAYGGQGGGDPAAPDAMQLRATTLSPDGVLGRDTAVDLQTCSCCQTSLAATGDGTVLAAYRDRSGTEIRDISVARRTGDGWQPPVTVHDDRWELSGCPVNGPAIAARGNRAVVAWFTGAQGVAAVKVGFSDDGGRSFGAPVRIDRGHPVGRVDTVLLEDGSALVSWVEWSAGEEALVICRVTKGAGCVAGDVVATNAAGASVNFPDMVVMGGDLYIAWTRPDAAGDNIAMRRARLAR